jgi:hypothetical protein
VIATQIARKEGVGIPRRDDDVNAAKWREAIVWIPEVTIDPIWIVVTIICSPTASVISRTIFSSGSIFQ